MITYGRSVVTIADQLFGKDNTMSQEDKVKAAQGVYDAVLKAFPNLKALMLSSQKTAASKGYVETILGRRRHIPDMQLPEFEFQALPGYVNPDLDPMNIDTLSNQSQIPERIIRSLTEELKGYKYFGQLVKRINELKDEGIKVINNRPKITEASRQCTNCVDYDTEILTTRGWLRHNEIQVGDTILAYSLDSHEIVLDNVNTVIDSPGDAEVIHFDTPTFSAMSTKEHRWVVGEADELPRIELTENIYKNKCPDYPILRVANNSFEPNSKISDDELKILGWIMTDGSIGGPHYAIHLFQSVRRENNRVVYQDMIDTLARANIQITDVCRDEYYHEIYLKQNEFLKYVYHNFRDRVLSFEFVSTLSQRQCEILMRAMLQGDGSGVDGYGYPHNGARVSLSCKGELNRDVFQYLCFRAGYATNTTTVDMSKVDYPSNHIHYPSISNVPASTGIYYDICVLRIQRAHIYPHHKSVKSVEGVWCVSTNTGTWIARRDGKVYITGNSVVQGSAADMTKLAILMLETDPRWIELGGRLLVPVHDELVCEVPIDKWEEGGKLLSEIMSAAGDFLPFPINCDVETTLRWYGLSYPCPYPQPKSLVDMTEDEIKWIQYMIHEMEYELPVYLDENGDKPRGDAARGINGKMSPELADAIQDFKSRYGLSDDNQFIEFIHNKVIKGE